MVKVRFLAFGVALLGLIAVIPLSAQAHMDPGAISMLWQIVAAAAFGSLFFMGHAVSWLRAKLGWKGQEAAGYIFGIAFSAGATPLTLLMFDGHPLPRFNDLFLVGIVLTVYLFSWRPAAMLLAISTLVSAWVLPPYGSMRIVGVAEWYRLVSFVGVSIFLISLIARKKARAVRRDGSSTPLRMHGAAAGAD